MPPPAPGRVVDIADADVSVYFDVPDLFAAHQVPGQDDARVLRMLRAPCPLATADGWIVLAPVSGRQIKRALTAAGLEDSLDEMRSQPDPIGGFAAVLPAVR